MHLPEAQYGKGWAVLTGRRGLAQGRPRGQAAAAAVGAGADGRRRAGACFSAGDRHGGQGGGPQAHAGQRLGQGDSCRASTRILGWRVRWSWLNPTQLFPWVLACDAFSCVSCRRWLWPFLHLEAHMLALAKLACECSAGTQPVAMEKCVLGVSLVRTWLQSRRSTML